MRDVPPPRIAAFLLTLLLLFPSAAPSQQSTTADPLEVIAESSDLVTIEKYFEKRGYAPPRGAHLIIGRIVKSEDGPRVAFFSLGKTGFTSGSGSFWPASMVKLVSAVGALTTLSKFGLDGSSRISFTDGRGRYKGTVSRLYGSALSHSNNLAYDRLSKIAGYDVLNGGILTPVHGYPTMAIQCAYDPLNDSDFRTSPVITYKDGKKKGEIPARTSTLEHPTCPDGDNCASLYELLMFLARVVLHDELAPEQRFPIGRIDQRGLKRFLEKAPSRIRPAIEDVFGEEVVIYNKGGRVPDLVANDHALVVDRKTRRRYLIGASIDETEGKDETKERLNRLVTMGLRAVLRPSTELGGLRGFEEFREQDVALEARSGAFLVDAEPVLQHPQSGEEGDQ